MQIHQASELMQRAWCFIGTPGTEKTRTLRTFKPPDWKPGDHPWAYVFACDRKKDGGMAVLRGVEGIDYGVFVNPEMHAITSMREQYEYPEPKALENFITQFNALLDMARDPDTFPYYVVSIDTVSGLTDLIYDELMFKTRNRTQNPKVSAELRARVRPSMSDIGDCQHFLMQYLKALIQLPCITLAVCHQYFVQEDIEKRMKYFPTLPGQKINDAFLSMFDEVVFFQRNMSGVLEVLTQPTLQHPARTSQPALAPKEKPDYQVWAGKIQKYYGSC